MSERGRGRRRTPPRVASTSSSSSSSSRSSRAVCGSTGQATEVEFYDKASKGDDKRGAEDGGHGERHQGAVEVTGGGSGQPPSSPEASFLSAAACSTPATVRKVCVMNTLLDMIVPLFSRFSPQPLKMSTAFGR